MSVAETTTPEVTEEIHQEAESRIKVFRYKRPEGFDRPKVSVRLGQTDIIRGHIQVIKNGGENNLHYHTKVDAIFTCLAGRLRFYGPGDELIGEFGPKEGCVMPRNARYWFESVGDEVAEVMLVQAFIEPGAKLSGRTDSEPQKLPDAGSGIGATSAVVNE